MYTVQVKSTPKGNLLKHYNMKTCGYSCQS